MSVLQELFIPLEKGINRNKKQKEIQEKLRSVTICKHIKALIGILSP